MEVTVKLLKITYKHTFGRNMTCNKTIRFRFTCNINNFDGMENGRGCLRSFKMNYLRWWQINYGNNQSGRMIHVFIQKHSKDALMPDLDSGVWTSMQTIIFMQVAIIIFENGIPLKMGLFALRWNSDLPVPVNTNEQITWPVLFLPTGVGWSVLTAENRKCMKTSKCTHTCYSSLVFFVSQA